MVFIFSNSIVLSLLSKNLNIKIRNHRVIPINIKIASFIYKANSIQEKISPVIAHTQKNILYFEIKVAYSPGEELLKI
jgi:hypothetical protein